MIYPSTSGRFAGDEYRLNTLETVWIQGKLRLWGRWSYTGSATFVNMFNKLLVSETISKKAINQILLSLKKSGLTRDELAIYLDDLLKSKYKSGLAFCSDTEAMIIDRVIGEIFIDQQPLLSVLHQRYIGRGKSKKQMARELNVRHPGWSLRTCVNRIDVWLNLAESMLYLPICDAFDTNSGRFRLKSCTQSG
ncbi:DUF1133 family protein [Erwiniaceae bacterium BAC15a-03b]|uniref:DUF1133 family protein n=1 Tax=Winslowiella arboricola TaxID=2978220 RepID=A0A9J6PPA6_9GAMM|nr:DUF1133 family protein [Winslowiella arboricola]MCU5774719.1 DUF1133 family protein [Winslowiella arboricola]MCU5780129.1 DUF1133 family protein [Winslowiella arboricola]